MPVKPCEIPCPKCGSNDIYKNYYPKDAQINRSSINDAPRTTESEYVEFLDKYTGKAKKDCIICICRCCRFEWEVAPLEPNKGKSNAKKA